jgi:beta-lactamase regulating signal transducer with metallopeptidase domain
METRMRLGSSLLLIAVGAVLRWAITATTSGVNLHTVGVILMVIGAVGFVISLYWMLVVSQSVARRDGYTDGTAADPRVTQPRA